jgi:hypothetical protein
MDKQIKHWITVLQRIKTELLWTPADQFPSTEKIEELIKEMAQVQDDKERGLSPCGGCGEKIALEITCKNCSRKEHPGEQEI